MVPILWLIRGWCNFWKSQLFPRPFSSILSHKWRNLDAIQSKRFSGFLQTLLFLSKAERWFLILTFADELCCKMYKKILFSNSCGCYRIEKIFWFPEDYTYWSPSTKWFPNGGICWRVMIRNVLKITVFQNLEFFFDRKDFLFSWRLHILKTMGQVIS